MGNRRITKITENTVAGSREIFKSKMPGESEAD